MYLITNKTPFTLRFLGISCNLTFNFRVSTAKTKQFFYSYLWARTYSFLQSFKMAQNHHVNIDFKNSEAEVKANIVLLSFKESDNFIIYSPHLEVTGYGKSEDEAMQSFNHSLAAFLDYTVNKKTLHEELASLGWQLKKGTSKNPKRINAPSWRELLKNNATLEDLLNKQDITTSHKEVAIPV